MEKINKNKALEIINNTKGKIFTVNFIKKDGSLRKMNCRQGVKKHLKGGKPAYDFKSKGLISVYDLQSKGYRTININTLQTLKTENQTFQVLQENQEFVYKDGNVYAKLEV